MRSQRTWLILAVVLIVGGLVIVHTDHWRGFSFATIGVATPKSFYIVTRRMAGGYGLVWLGTMVLAGLGGYRIAKR